MESALDLNLRLQQQVRAEIAAVERLLSRNRASQTKISSLARAARPARRSIHQHPITFFPFGNPSLSSSSCVSTDQKLSSSTTEPIPINREEGIRYAQEQRKSLRKSGFSAADDAGLRAAVSLHGLVWSNVSMGLGGHTSQQCMHRWSKGLAPGIRHGKWTEAEDKRLVVGVAFGGATEWPVAAACVGERTDVQCRERWANVLCPELKQGPWNETEDAALLAAVEELGAGRWAAVAKRVPYRTDNACWRRWKDIARKQKTQKKDSPTTESQEEAGKTDTKRNRRRTLKKTAKKTKKDTEDLGSNED